MAFLPPVSMPYLVDLFFEVGPATSTGMGQALLTHEEIGAWQRNMNVELRPWEMRAMRRMSAEWIAEAQAAEDPKRPPPYAGSRNDMRENVANKLDNLL